MLSRVAESVHWMHRYVERSENVARFIHVNLHLLLDFDGHAGGEQWEPLVTTSGDHVDFKKRYGESNERNVIRFLTFDRQNPNSIISCLRSARENARSIRDTISSEMWNHLNRTYLEVERASERARLRDLNQFYGDIKDASHHLFGLADATMSHNEAWHFGRLGSMIERADKTARILDVRYFMLLPSLEYVDSPYDSILWIALLKSTSAFEMYRKAHPQIHHRDVAAFLIFNPEFPRSLRWCIGEAARSLRHITEGMEAEPRAAEELRILASILDATNITEILDRGLHEFIDLFETNLNIVGRQIHESFFALRSPDEPLLLAEQRQS